MELQRIPPPGQLPFGDRSTRTDRRAPSQSGGPDWAPNATETENVPADQPGGKTPGKPTDKNTDPQIKAQLSELARRDREVRAHETAHAAVGGAYVRGGPSLNYTTGPDGKRYAVGGEVQIDTSAVPGDPKATAQKMRAVTAAALAPAQPSGQDLAVAAAASRAEAQASLEAAAARMTQFAGGHLGTRVDHYG